MVGHSTAGQVLWFTFINLGIPTQTTYIEKVINIYIMTHYIYHFFKLHLRFYRVQRICQGFIPWKMRFGWILFLYFVVYILQNATAKGVGEKQCSKGKIRVESWWGKICLSEGVGEKRLWICIWYTPVQLPITSRLLVFQFSLMIACRQSFGSEIFKMSGIR